MSTLNWYGKIGIATILFLGATPAFANGPSDVSGGQAIGFDRIWGLVQKSAPSLKAAGHESEAARIGADRASRHWYPRVYATGRAFSTNDPGTSFMYSLEQRQIGAADFAPAALNQPGSSFFEQGTLGLDLLVYEGGARVAQYHAAEKGAEAKVWESKAKAISEFARVAEDYAGLLALIEERRQLGALRESVSGVIDHYSIGSKSNPVGYSGLLGLKNLRNRIDGLLAENEAKGQSKRSDLQALASELPDSWLPEAHRAKEFLDHVFPRTSGQPSTQGADVAPAPVEAARLGAESLDQAKDGEKAKFLPRLGLFAQGDLYGGNRATATSYSSGAYLQWDLFSAPNFGAIGQAEHQAAAAQAKADELRNRLASDHVAAESGAKASERSLTLLDESADLLEEQTQTARGLFRSGSINALQLVEVLNRRADLLVNRAQAELQLAQMKAALFMTSARSVSFQSGSTESNGGAQ